MAKVDSLSEKHLVALLNKFRKKKDRAQATKLHAYMRHQHLETHPILGNYLVPMLVDCGCLPDAQIVFDRLRHRNEQSWSSLISGYVHSGNSHHAFHLYHLLQQQDCVQPNVYIFLGLLRACASLKDAEKGRLVHTGIILKGFERDLFVASTLVDMYGKCTSPVEARTVFDKLPLRDAVSWRALIAGYDACDLGEEVLNCFEQMEQDGVSLVVDDLKECHRAGASERSHKNSCIFVALLRACIRLKDIRRGQSMHVQILKNGMDHEQFIGNTLVDMYGKSGLLSEAHVVFGTLPFQDTVSWTALILAYAEHGLVDYAISCFEKMRLQGACLEDDTVEGGNALNYIYVALLTACIRLKDIDTGQKVHADITLKGLERELFIGNTLVDLYGKCGLRSEAQLVFLKLPMRDAVSWNAMTMAYVDHGSGEDALKCFKQMQYEGFSPVDITYTCNLKACGMLKRLERGQELHSELTKKGLERELHVGTALVDMYAKCASLKESCRVFDRLTTKDGVSWAALVSGYAEGGMDIEVLSCFQRIQCQGVRMDAMTLVRCLRACGNTGALAIGQEIHVEIGKSGFQSHFFVGNMLVDMYGKCGALTEAREVFDKLPVQDVVSWTAMVRAYSENHAYDMAAHCFEDMVAHNVKPDAITFTCLLAACSHANLVLKGQEYFKLMTEKHNIAPTMDHCTCMVDLLARSGNFQEAESFAAALQCSTSRDILGAFLYACKIYGKVELGHRYFKQLLKVQEDAAAYLLMADIYASSNRWIDVDRLEALRKHVGAKKILATASIEVNKSLHEFVVGVYQGMEMTTMVKALSSHLKDDEYIPSLDLVIRQEGKS